MSETRSSQGASQTAGPQSTKLTRTYNVEFKYGKTPDSWGPCYTASVQYVDTEGVDRDMLEYTGLVQSFEPYANSLTVDAGICYFWRHAQAKETCESQVSEWEKRQNSKTSKTGKTFKVGEVADLDTKEGKGFRFTVDVESEA